MAKVNLKSESISPDDKLSLNALYYWKTLNCPKVLSAMLKPNDSDSIVKPLESKIKSDVTAIHTDSVTAAQTESAKINVSTSNVQTASYGKKNLEKAKQPSNQCHDMKTQYYVVPGISWGSLPPDLQK